MYTSKACLLAAILGVAALLVATATSAQNSAANSEARIRNLMIEKRDTLSSKLTYAEAQHRQGTLQIGAVLNARLDLLDAELALAESAAGRARILEEKLDNRRANESRLEELYKIGDISYGERVDATVQRIDAEIALARETKDN